jgi:hypothetical protein
MTATPGCGPHCGTVNSDERHCGCGDPCRAGHAPPAAARPDGRAAGPRGLSGEPLTGTPMCARWYDRAGDHRPWTARLDGCVCGVSAQALYEQHGAHCPVRVHWARKQPGQDPAEAADVINATGA